MNFEVTRSNLERLSKMSSYAPEDVLNFIYDFCKETQRFTGKPLSSVSANDIDVLMKRLPWAGQYIVDMAHTNEPQILSDARRERLSRLTDNLAGLSKQIEAENAVLQEIEKNEQNLVRRQEKLSGIKKEQQRILSSCDMITQEIDKLSNMDTQALKAEENRLLAQKSELEKELESAKIKNEGINKQLSSLIKLRSEAGILLEKKKNELRNVNDEVSAAKSEIKRVENSIYESLKTLADQMKEKKALEEKMDDDKRKLENEIAEIDKIIESKNEERNTLLARRKEKEKAELDVKEEISNIGAEIVKYKENYEKLSRELAEKQNERDTEIEQIKDLKEKAEELDQIIIAAGKDIEAKKLSIDSLEKIKDGKIGQKNELDSRVTELNKECAKLTEEIRVLKKNLQEKDFTDQILILKKERREKEANLAKYDETKSEIKKVEDEIKNLKSELLAAEKNLQDENNELQMTKNNKLERLNSLKQQQSKLKQKISDYEIEIHSLEEWMKDIEARKLNEQAERLYERVSKLSGVRDKLEEVLQSSWYQNRYTNKKMTVQTAYIGQRMRDDLDNMGKQLSAYRNSLTGVIECLGSEHLD